MCKENGKERKCLSILREARQFSIEKRQQMPKVNTRKIEVVSRIKPLMSSKFFRLVIHQRKSWICIMTYVNRILIFED